MKHVHIMSKVKELGTPCLVVDRARVQRNCERMKNTCDELGLQLRPMTKTHKCVEAGEMSTMGSKRCVACSTLPECEMYAKAGFDDILFTRIFTPDRIPRMQALLRQLDAFHVMLDSEYGLQLLVSHKLDTKPWSVFLKIDTGDKRAGVLWDSDDVTKMAALIQAEPCLDFQGIYAHDGHSYDMSAARVKHVSAESVERLTSVKQRLESKGIACKTVGVGSTPCCSQTVEDMKQLTELHPGNYVFMDYQQYSLGSCELSDIAGRVATRVSGHYPHRNQLLIDAGFLATSHDGAGRLPHGGSYAAIDNEPNLKLVKVNQEVGFVEPVEGTLDYDRYPIGSMLFLLPWHSCATAAMHGQYHVCEGDNVVTTWSNCHYW